MAPISTFQLRDRYDVVIVGARCAGAATAMLLAREGFSVLALESSRYGTDTLSTHALMRGGVLQLHRWGILEQLKATGTPPIVRTVFHYGEEAVTVPIKARNGVDALYAPRRTVLDSLLVDAARAAGATVVHGARVMDLRRSPSGRVDGAIARLDGDVTVIGAGLVVGADGLNSTVARLSGAAITAEGTHATGVLYGYWAGVEVDGSHWYFRPGIGAGAIPTTSGLTCVFVAASREQFMRSTRFDRDEHYIRALREAAPDLADAISRGGTRVGSLRGFAGERGYMKRCAGPGWALVGDAGYFRDPITAHGITDAFRDAELLSRAVVRGGPEAFAEYQSTRDAFAAGLFAASDEAASFDWDIARVQAIHRYMSEEMNREVEMLLALDAPQPVAV